MEGYDKDLREGLNSDLDHRIQKLSRGYTLLQEKWMEAADEAEEAALQLRMDRIAKKIQALRQQGR